MSYLLFMPLDSIPSQGVDNVEDSIDLLTHFFEIVKDQAIVFGERLIIAVIVFFLGRWLIRFLKSFFDGFLRRRKIENTAKTFLNSVADITLKIVLLLLIANILGLSMTSFAAILAAVGLAVGMAMKDNLSNFAGGVLLLLNKPFKVGDRIVAQNMDGVVDSIGILYTVLLTGDNKTIFIPNGPLSTGNIINYSTQKQRRVDITLNLNHGVNIDEVKEILRDIIASEPRVKYIPSQPFIGVTMLNNGTIDVTIRVWVESADYSGVNIYLNETVYNTFIDREILSKSSLSVRMLKD